MKARSDATHFDEKRAIRWCDPYGVPIRAATRSSWRIVSYTEVIPKRRFEKMATQGRVWNEPLN
jgi:hypothetical protein